MKNKTLNLLFVSVFAFVFLMTFASATITLTGFPTSELAQTPLTGSFNFTATTDVLVGETVDFSIADIVYDGKTIDFSVPASVFVTTDTPVSVTYIIESDFNFEFAEEFKTTLSITDSSSNIITRELSFAESDFCEYDNQGDLKVTIRGIDVVEGLGKDNEWYAFDKVEVEVRIENNGDEDLDAVVVEWGLYNTQSKEWTIELTEEDDFNLDSDESEDLVFEFTIDDDLDEDLADLEEGDYVFYVKATGEITDGTYEGENSCSSDSEEASLTVEDDFVVLYNFEIAESVQCDSEVTVSAEAWNIGSDDQEGVYVEIYNKDLGLDEKVEIGDIDAFDNEEFSFTFNVPEDVEEKNYVITFTVYDEDEDVYENSDDDKSISTVDLKVDGGCFVAGATVDAVLESGGKAGRDMVVRATITNIGNKVTSYSLNVAGYAEWASAVTLDNNVLTLNEGESQDVLLTFNVNKEALGVQSFALEVISENKLVSSQPVQVEITKGGFLGNLFSGNKTIWGIGLLNLVLVVLIIVIAVRLSRKRK